MDELNWSEALSDMMKTLREQCPWDKVQTFESLVPHTLEEAYEVADAIARKNPADLKNELGDLLFQVFFYAQIASEQGDFSLKDVAWGLHEKMLERHPHVFGEERFESAEAQSQAWEAHKQDQKSHQSVCDDIPQVLPALSRAQKLQKRAASVGFDWENASQVWEKCQEEQQEIQEVLSESSPSIQALEEEIGDLFFALVNFARHWKLDAEAVMRKANEKFEKRFRMLEGLVQDKGEKIQALSLDELEEYWKKVKIKP